MKLVRIVFGLSALLVLPCICIAGEVAVKSPKPKITKASLASAGSSRRPAKQATPATPTPLYREDVSLEEMHRYHQ